MTAATAATGLRRKEAQFVLIMGRTDEFRAISARLAELGAEKVQLLKRRFEITGCACLSYMPEHGVWAGMKARCLNPKHPSFDNYGGRGIRICDRWRESFETFICDVGLRPSAEHSIDRINNDGHYEPSNCRWATPKEQANNKRPGPSFRRSNRHYDAFIAMGRDPYAGRRPASRLRRK